MGRGGRQDCLSRARTAGALTMYARVSRTREATPRTEVTDIAGVKVPCADRLHQAAEYTGGVEPPWTVLQTASVSRTICTMIKILIRGSARVDRAPPGLQSGASTELAYCPYSVTPMGFEPILLR